MENNLIKKAVSFSLYGNNPKYTKGLLNNIPLVSTFYPGWKIFVYYNNTVPNDIIDELSNTHHVKLINMSESILPGMFWRFLVNDDDEVDLFIVRDADSRVSLRESIAVHSWLQSGKKLHIMRDHPHHTFKILGGMWGLRVTNKNIEKLIINYLGNNNYSQQVGVREIDQNFLRDTIYKKYYFSSLIHAEYNKYEFFSKKFPVDRYDSYFVGEIYDENDKRTSHFNLL
jgi:hypothetical protein